jgi:hypothetical protein
MTGRWLMLSEVSRRISAATGEPVSVDDVIALGDDDGPLQAQFMHGYWSVLEESVTAYLESVSERAGRKAEDVAGKPEPTVGRWSRAEEPDSFAERGDYTDTPNDEGDNEQ